LRVRRREPREIVRRVEALFALAGEPMRCLDNSRWPAILPAARVDTLSVEALDGLTAAITDLLPAAPDPTFAPALLVQPRRIAPAGVGGFVGVHDAPRGEIYGRRLEAIAVVTVRASGSSALNTAVAGVSQALLAADRAALRGAGILRLAAGDLGPRSAGEPAPGGVAERDVAFDVLYEFLKLPEAGEGVIQEIPITLDVDQALGVRASPAPPAPRPATPKARAAAPAPSAPTATRRAARRPRATRPRQGESRAQRTRSQVREQSGTPERPTAPPEQREQGARPEGRGVAAARTRRRGGTAHG
jgi:hypothetical protein